MVQSIFSGMRKYESLSQRVIQPKPGRMLTHPCCFSCLGHSRCFPSTVLYSEEILNFACCLCPSRGMCLQHRCADHTVLLNPFSAYRKGAGWFQQLLVAAFHTAAIQGNASLDFPGSPFPCSSSKAKQFLYMFNHKGTRYSQLLLWSISITHLPQL